MMQTNAGQFILTAGTNTLQEITGVGFKPTVLFLWTTGATWYGNQTSFPEPSITGVDMKLSFGFAIGPTSRQCVSAVSGDGLTTTIDKSGSRTDAVFATITTQASPSWEFLVDLFSFDSDGFTLIVNQAPATPIRYVVNWFAISTDEYTNISTGSLSASASSGNQSFTGVGFKPTFLCLIGTVDSATSVNTIGANSGISVGFADGSLNNCIASVYGKDAVTTTVTRKMGGTSGCLSPLRQTSSYLASIVSYDPDGFTLNFGAAPAGVTPFQYLAIQGGLNVVMGQTAASLVNGTVPVPNFSEVIGGTTIGMTSPLFAAFRMDDANSTSQTATVNGAQASWGVTCISTNRAVVNQCASCSSQVAVTTSNVFVGSSDALSGMDLTVSTGAQIASQSSAYTAGTFQSQLTETQTKTSATVFETFWLIGTTEQQLLGTIAAR